MSVNGVWGGRFDVLDVALMKRQDAVEINKHFLMFTKSIATAAQ
jgi:hypothetical protein